MRLGIYARPGVADYLFCPRDRTPPGNELQHGCLYFVGVVSGIRGKRGEIESKPLDAGEKTEISAGVDYSGFCLYCKIILFLKH